MGQTWGTLGTPMASPQQTVCLCPSHHSRHGPAVPLLQPLRLAPRPGPGGVPSVSLGGLCCTSSQHLNPPSSTRRMTGGCGGQLDPGNQPGTYPWGSILHPLPVRAVSSSSSASKGPQKGLAAVSPSTGSAFIMVGSMSSPSQVRTTVTFGRHKHSVIS